MKQRLLLALLVLFASVGMVKADGSGSGTITIPANSPVVKLTVTPGNEAVTVKVENTDLTGSGNVYTVNPSTSEQTVKITGNTISQLTIDGQVSNVNLSLSALTSLTFNNNSGMLNSLSLNGTKLTTLNADNCALTALPTDGLAIYKAVTVSVKNNKISDLSSLNISRTTALTYQLDGNNIIKTPSTSNNNVTFNYGVQKVAANLDSNPVANKWFNVKNSLIGTGKIPALSNLEASKASVTWQDKDNRSVTLTQGDNKWDYKFFAGGKFLSGAMQCKIVPNADLKLPSYLITFNVDPAQFSFKQTPSFDGDDNGNKLAVTNTTEGSRTTTVWEGDELYLSPAAAQGYSFENYTLSGLVKTTTTNIYKVNVTKVDQEEVSVVANFKQKSYAVSMSVSANGSVEVRDENNKLLEGTSFNLPAGTTLYIKATPSDGYEALVSNNGTVITEETTGDHQGEYKCAINAASTIDVKFQQVSNNPKLTINKGDEGIDQIVINGKVQTFNSNSTTSDNQDLKAGNTVMVEVTPSTSYNVTEIILDGKVIASNSKKAQFTMPATDAVLSFKVVSASAITIVPGENQYTYDGKEKEFAFTTVPDGITGFTVKYAREGVDNYLTDKPKASGTYHVSLYRAADDLYSKVDVKYNENNSSSFIITIGKATPKITSGPTVTVNANKQYVVSGNASVPGKFAVVKDDNTNEEVTACTKAINHNVLVKFTPTDKTNYTEIMTTVPVQVEKDPVQKFKVSWKIPENMTLVVKNGDKEITSGTEVASDINLNLSLAFPAGYTNVELIEDNSDATPVLKKEDSATELPNPLIGTYEVTKQVTFKVVTEGAPAEKKTPKVKITAPTTNGVTYNGSVQLVSTEASTTTDYKIEWEVPTSAPTPLPALKITYKDAAGKVVTSPVNAGKYTVCVHIPEFTTTDGTDVTTYKANDQEFVEAFEIKKAKPEVSAWPEKAVLGTGLTLSQATFMGGSANVAGKFVFVDGTIKPEKDKEYSVKFVPADTNNNEEVTTGGNDDKPCQLKVTISDQRIVAFDNIINGTITVKGSDGVTYKSGDALPASVTSVTVTATPATGYKLATLTVNGTSITNGSSYKLGETSITIAATFDAYYKVTVTKPTKGIVVTLPSNTEVKKGESYSFTVAALAADMSRIVVKDGTTTVAGSNGRYTISNISENKAITITLDNPTAITVVADTTLSPGKKPMGTVTFTGLTDGKCYYNDRVTVKATPVSGVRFAGWTGTTETASSFTFTATAASYKFKALYSGSPVGVETIEGVKIYGSKGAIVVNCDSDAIVTIISMNGQSSKHEISGDARIPANAGIYGVVLQKGSETIQTKVMVR